MEERSRQEENWFYKLEERDRERQREERWDKIVASKYNKWYREVIEQGIPGYLKKGWGENRWRRIARFRLGNEVKGGRYWEEEDERRCRLCGGEEETWEHVWEGCRTWKEGGCWQEAVGWVLGGKGKGENWMKELEKERERRWEAGRDEGMRDGGGNEGSGGERESRYKFCEWN